MKDPRNRVHELLDRHGPKGSTPDPTSADAELLARYRNALDNLSQSRAQAPEGFCDRVMASLPETDPRPRRLQTAVPFFSGWRRAVPTMGGTLALGLLLVVTYVREPFPLPFFNDRPVACTDVYAVNPGGTLNIPSHKGVLSNDSDPDSAHHHLQAHLVCKEFSLEKDGSFTYKHDGVPEEDDSFSYRPFDGKKYGEPVVVSFLIP